MNAFPVQPVTANELLTCLMRISKSLQRIRKAQNEKRDQSL